MDMNWRAAPRVCKDFNVLLQCLSGKLMELKAEANTPRCSRHSLLDRNAIEVRCRTGPRY